MRTYLLISSILLFIINFLNLYVNAQNYNCTMVIGYSQVGAPYGGWYVSGSGAISDFEQAVGDSNWQLLWNSGGGIDQWKNPNYSGWSNSIQSTCSISSGAPERIVLSISGSYGANITSWVNDINSTIITIRLKYPSVQQIVLQPVVGGPAHQTCYVSGDSIRASWQHKYIDSAIAIVVGMDSLVSSECSPEVNYCNDYRDMVGHLDTSAAHIIGAEIGQCYTTSMGNSIVETTDDAFKIFPNPSYGKFSLQSLNTNDNLSINIYNYIGDLILNSIDKKEYDLSGHPSGIYIIQFTSGSITGARKILIIR